MAGRCIHVYGTPAPQGSKRHVGGGRMIESSAAVAPWREAVKWAWLAQQPGVAPMEGPVAIDIDFTLKKPLSAPKLRRIWPAKKPDLDKLIRSTLDALTDAGAFIDDSQIIRITAAKYFPSEGANALDQPGAVIIVWPAGNTPSVDEDQQTA